MESSNFTLLVRSAQGGDRTAESAVYRLAFPRLRRTAAMLLTRESPSHLLQPTALVGELFFKLRRLDHHILGREHFFRLAARAMRQTLVDYGRKRRAQKRMTPDGPPQQSHAGLPAQEMHLAARQVFERLQRHDPLAAECVWMRRVEGRTLDEVARLQNRKVWSVRNDYDFGVEWMARQLST